MLIMRLCLHLPGVMVQKKSSYLQEQVLEEEEVEAEHPDRALKEVEEFPGLVAEEVEELKTSTAEGAEEEAAPTAWNGEEAMEAARLHRELMELQQQFFGVEEEAGSLLWVEQEEVEEAEEPVGIVHTVADRIVADHIAAGSQYFVEAEAPQA